MCHLKGKWSERKVGQGNNVISGLPWCPVSFDTCYLLKTDLKNSRLEDVGDVTTLEQCRKKSSKNLASNIFTYHASTKMCYIKHIMSGTDPDRDAEGFVSGWQGCACGKYGTYFDSTPAKTFTNFGNIDMCYKLCKSEAICKYWTYNLEKNECFLYDGEITGLSFASYPYNAKTNPRVSGPKDCGFV